MPVRPLTSTVFRWPSHADVVTAAREWAAETAARHATVSRIGYFGSYARQDAGVGSDLDILVIVAVCREPFERRSASFDTRSLPVSADVLVYTEREWVDLHARRMGAVLREETVWLYERTHPAKETGETDLRK